MNNWETVKHHNQKPNRCLVRVQGVEYISPSKKVRILSLDFYTSTAIPAMKKIKLGIILGIVAGIIDIIPMIFQGLTWDANLSAFTFWIAAGFFISTTKLYAKGAVKGVIISLIMLVPLAFIIGWQEPTILIPIIIMNVILGSLLGYYIEKFGEWWVSFLKSYFIL